MPRNQVGGSRHKKMAKKRSTGGGGGKGKTRFAREGEQYAKVLKAYGNGMFDVICNDNKLRSCIVRAKFKGRNKRDNIVKIDNIILVGLREWEVVSEKKKPKVDLLCTYNEAQMEEIKSDKSFNRELIGQENEEKKDDAVSFTYNASEVNFNSETTNTITQNVKISYQKTQTSTENKTPTDINWDDI